MLKNNMISHKVTILLGEILKMLIKALMLIFHEFYFFHSLFCEIHRTFIGNKLNPIIDVID
jgi:hypothetical protein